MEVSSRNARVLAHRGLWGDQVEASSAMALTRALEEGFGLETDLRDLAGRLVVSHDPPVDGAPQLINLLESWLRRGLLGRAPLALNVKADGLVSLLSDVERLLQTSTHYFFDMSFPQLREFARSKLPVALRVSEFEPMPEALVHQLNIGERYWLDGFESDWWLGNKQVEEACRRGEVAVVSPEIHGRNPRYVWEWFAEMVKEGCDITICTDRPYEVMDMIS